MAENSHIEDFFKKHLASREFPYQEEDWLKLERKLEWSGSVSGSGTLSHLPVRLILIILAALTAAFFLGWLARDLIRTKKNATTEEITPVRSINETVAKSETEAKNSGSGTDTKETDTKDLTAGSATKDFTPGPEITSLANGSEADDLSSGTGNKDLRIKEEKTTSDQAVSVDHITESSETNVNSDLYAYFEPPSVSVTGSNNQGTVRDETGLDELPVLQKYIPGYRHSKELLFPVVNEPLQLGQHTSFSRWSAGLLLSPDMNSTGIWQQKSVSPAYGVVITYSFTPRWSLSARILYNNKKYVSSSENYNAPDSYWQYRTNGVVPDEIDASCRVIDVPVMLGYIYYKQKRITLKASAGIGSYFLMDEVYRFRFDQPNPGAATEWKTNENSQNWFSVVNLSTGISLKTGNRTSFTIEPYVKLPLKRMGWGEVNLSGMGVAFIFNYDF